METAFYIFIYFALFFVIYVYAENKLIIIRKYKLSLKHNRCGKVRIVQISDIHKERNLKRIAIKTRDLKPDIILLTGDIVSRTESNLTRLNYLLYSLSKICPVYACAGNHELDLPENIYEKYKKIMDLNGIKYLDNMTETVVIKGAAVNIAGTPLKKSIYRNENGGYSGLERLTAEELEGSLGKKHGFTILLAHNPLCADAYAKWGADAVFCGHIHGGSIRLPFIGGLLSPERRFFPQYSKGVYHLGNTVMVVSGGIGKPRIFNPPEIVCCEIE